MYYLLAGLGVAAVLDFLLALVKSTKENHAVNYIQSLDSICAKNHSLLRHAP